MTGLRSPSVNEFGTIRRLGRVVVHAGEPYPDELLGCRTAATLPASAGEDETMESRKQGFTLVELLVVIAIIGILVGLLLPAVQAAREAARRMQCGNNLHQMAIAAQNYHDSFRAFPSGFVLPNQVLWSGMLLPQLEQNTIYDSLNFSATWASGANAAACSTLIPMFRCPSAPVEEHTSVQGITDRVPCTYIACGTGLLKVESGPSPVAGDAEMDGMFFLNSDVKLRDILDGSSTTVAIGESLFDTNITGIDHGGTVHIVDHWYIGSPNIHRSDVSETIGSTAVPVNRIFDQNAFIDEKELCFSSRHPGGAQVAFADGHVSIVAESIDANVWSALGTRAHGESTQTP
ncbi:MAG TPA: DUF1559 domain-containing protein [Pirellulaceae bacterium]|nr:DUF1559 domain-containing protein [Pirellulaceae bacterium]